MISEVRFTLRKTMLNVSLLRVLYFKFMKKGSLSKSMKDFEKLSESRKLQNLHFHVLDYGTYTSEHCDPQYFDVLPLMEEIEVEPEISEKSFLENSVGE